MTKSPRQIIVGFGPHNVVIARQQKKSRRRKKRQQEWCQLSKWLARSQVDWPLQLYDRVRWNDVITIINGHWSMFTGSHACELHQRNLARSSTSCLNVGRSSGLQQKQAMSVTWWQEWHPAWKSPAALWNINVRKQVLDTYTGTLFPNLPETWETFVEEANYNNRLQWFRLWDQVPQNF